MPLTPRPPSAHDPVPTDNDLLVSDIHGDRQGLENLLRTAKYNPDKQRLFTLGDNTDRGNDVKGVLDLLNKYGATHIQSNHDWAHFRNARHMIAQAETGKKNPMKPGVEMQDTMRQLGDDYRNYVLPMGDYPLYLPFHDAQGQGYLVHGGVDPIHNMEEQLPDKMLVRRHHPMPNQFIEHETEEHPYWQRSYNGHLGHIIHGHMPLEHHQVHGNQHVTSLDGGGVFGDLVPWGGKHRAIRLGDRQIFEVPGSDEASSHYKNLLLQKRQG